MNPPFDTHSLQSGFDDSLTREEEAGGHAVDDELERLVRGADAGDVQVRETSTSRSIYCLTTSRQRFQRCAASGG